VAYINFEDLAQDYAREPERARQLVAWALLIPGIDTFIDQHKDGWQGVNGEFARILARVNEAML
jgi:hypothetical protein